MTDYQLEVISTIVINLSIGILIGFALRMLLEILS